MPEQAAQLRRRWTRPASHRKSSECRPTLFYFWCFLADPAKQWPTGYSDKTLDRCWENSRGLQKEIASMFRPHEEL